MMRSRVSWVGLFLAYFILASAPAAHAYLDPGSGSLIFQIVIGGVLGAAVAIKTFWGRIVGLFARRNRKSTDEPLSEKVD